MKKIPDKYEARFAYLAVFSAILTALSQITAAWYLAAICIVPLYFCLFYLDRRSAVRVTAIFMFVYHGIMCSFLMTLYDYLDIPVIISLLLCIAAVAALTLLQSAVMMLAVYPAVATEHKSRAVRIIAFSACFTLGQFLLEIIPVVAFPWARLENSLAYQPILLQSAALLGGGFTAFLILLFNGIIACLLISLFSEDVKRTLGNSIVLAFFFSAVMLFSAAYMLSKDRGSFITVAAVQGSKEGLLKTSQSSDDAAHEYSELISELSDKSMELILLPETAVPTVLSQQHTQLLSHGLDSGTAIVTGCIYSDDDGRRYNCLAALDDNSSHHLKQVLVPLGEYVPFFEIDGFSSLTPSETGDTISLRGHKYAALICIESIFSSLLSDQIDSGGELILLSTNDSWFKSSFAREVHFRHSIVRAAEYDRYLLRSGNCGISALIDRSGRIVDAQYGKESSAIVARAELVQTRTPYAVLGNVFQLPALLYVLRFYLLSIIYKILHRSKNTSQTER